MVKLPTFTIKINHSCMDPMGMVGILPLMTSLFVCGFQVPILRFQGKEGKIQKEDFVKRGSLALENVALELPGGWIFLGGKWKMRKMFSPKDPKDPPMEG